jgi:hypothetical protein
MERPLKCVRTGTINTVMVLLVVGSVSSTMIFSYKQAAFAHVFTGDESASFMSVIKTLQAEANLVQTNLTTNQTLAQDHAKAVVNVVNGNHTFGVLPDEVSENNKRVASDVIRAANALQTAVKSKPTPTQTDLKPKVDNLNATLQEAIAVRLPKDAAGNSTINGLATKDLVNETLRQYSYAFGIANSKGGNNSISTNSATGNSVVNMSAYQSARALTSQAEQMFTQTKSLIPANATSGTKTAIDKVVADLSQLKNTIDTKSPYNTVTTLVQKTIYADLDAAFHLK